MSPQCCIIAIAMPFTWPQMQDCMTGPDPGPWRQSCCTWCDECLGHSPFDLDNDGDIDLFDFALFQNWWEHVVNDDEYDLKGLQMQLGDKVSFTKEDRKLEGVVYQIVSEDTVRVHADMDSATLSFKLNVSELIKDKPKKTSKKKSPTRGGL